LGFYPGADYNGDEMTYKSIPSSNIVDISPSAIRSPKTFAMGGSLKNLTQLTQIIKSLFSLGEQGFFYDPNDLSTMFQDAAGTVPVSSVGQPVGLVLDKSKGLVLGNELVTNGSFDNGTTGWVAAYQSALSNVGGKLRVTAIGTNPYGVQTISGLTVGKTYKLTYAPFVKTGTGVWVINLGNLPFGYQVQYGVVREPTLAVGGSFIFTATTTVLNIALVGGVGTMVGDYADFDNISVKEIAGNPAYQTTSSMRPLLVASPQRLDYDTVDDKLITNLPAQLTGCTVIHSVPNVGTQILTGQTIPATYNNNTDHCGLIVVNRALTLSETSIITVEFNKMAGV